MIRKKKMIEYFNIEKYLLMVLMIFISSFFIYKDFNIRMLLGYGILGLLIGIQCFYYILKRKKPTVSVIEVIFSIIVLTVGFSFLRTDANRKEDQWVYMIAMIISTAYLFFSQPDRKQLNNIMKIAVISALFFALFVLTFFIFEDLFWNSYYHILSEASRAYADRYIPRGFSPVLGGSCTYTDYVMMVGVGVFCGIFFSLKKESKKKKKIICIVAITILIFAFIVVGRRGELLGVIGAILIFWILTGKGRYKWVRLGGMIGGVIVILGLFVLFLPQLKEIEFLRRYVMTIEKLLAGQDITSGRTELYTQALNLFFSSPIFGIGWGQFACYVTPEFKAIHGQDVMNVHNIYLEFLCEVGIIGAIFIIVPMAYMLAKTIKQFVRLYHFSSDTENWRLAIQLNTASLMIQLFFIMVGLIDPCFSKVIFWAIYALAVKLFSCALEIENYNTNDIFIQTGGNILRKVITTIKRR